MMTWSSDVTLERDSGETEDAGAMRTLPRMLCPLLNSLVLLSLQPPVPEAP